jgi:hypothetical protein
MIDSTLHETGTGSANFKKSGRKTLASESRIPLNRKDIDAKAEEVVLHFDQRAFTRLRPPIYQVVAGLNDLYHIPFHFDQELGFSARGRKILGVSTSILGESL